MIFYDNSTKEISMKNKHKLKTSGSKPLIECKKKWMNRFHSKVMIAPANKMVWRVRNKLSKDQLEEEEEVEEEEAEEEEAYHHRKVRS